MLEIYSDKVLKIYFSETPKVEIRYILPWTTKEEIEEIKKKPFYCDNAIAVKICDLKADKDYNFLINKGYTWDGASIPRLFWRLIGAKTDNNFLIPSYIHDFLCENHFVIGYNRQLSSKVFKALLLSCGVSKIKSETMFLAVDNFQRFCGW